MFFKMLSTPVARSLRATTLQPCLTLLAERVQAHQPTYIRTMDTVADINIALGLVESALSQRDEAYY